MWRIILQYAAPFLINFHSCDQGTCGSLPFTLSPPAMIQRDRTEQIDGMINLARDQQGGID